MTEYSVFICPKKIHYIQVAQPGVTHSRNIYIYWLSQSLQVNTGNTLGNRPNILV